MAPLLAEVQLALNERSADRVAAQLKDQMGDAGQKSGREFSDNFHRGIGSMRGMGQVAATEFRTGLRGGIDDAVRDFTRQFGAAGDAANAVFGRINSGAGMAALGVAGIVGAVGTATAALYKLGSDWDNITDSMALSTGKVGDDLDKLMATVREVGASAAAPMETIGQVTGAVSQSLGLTGDQLAAMSKTLSEFKEQTGQAVDVKDMGKLFSQFDIAPDQMMAGVDSLYAASVKTQTSMNEVIDSMRKAGPAAKLAGLDFGQTAGLLTTLEEAGVDVTKAAPAMSIAMKQFAKDGESPAQGLRDTIAEIKNLVDASHEPEAAALAVQKFGRGYADLFDAIKDGRLTVDDFNKSLDGTKNALQPTLDSTKDLAEQVTILKNKLTIELAPAAEFAFGFINRNIEWSIIKPFELANDLIDKFTGKVESIPPVVSPITADSPLGQMLAPAGTADSRTPGSLPPGFGMTSDDFGLSMSPWHKVAKDKSKSGLPAAPVVPLAGLPGLMPGLTPTSGLLSAQQGVADAETKVAETKARVLQLDGSNIATEQDRLKARNDLRAAERDKLQADMRFNEAQQSALKAQNKAIDDLGKGLGKLGAQLDSDFGASGGLPGILENATKALANLGFAPVLGALRGVQAGFGYDQSDLGGGIIGALGATGAFGKQFVKDRSTDALSSGASTAAGSLNSLATAANAATGALGGGGSGGSDGASLPSLSSVMPGGGSSWWPGGTPAASTGGRVPYGLPRGSNSGGYGGGGVQFPDWVNQIAQQFGIKPSTYPGHQETNRSEAGFAPNPMDLNRAIDWSGPVPNMERFADYLATIPQDMEQVIWQNPQTGHRVGIAGGRDVSGSGYYADDFGGHQNHVHTRQSLSIPLPGGPLAAGSAGGGWASPRSAGGGGGGGGIGSGLGPGMGGMPRGLAPGFGIPGAPSILGMDPGGADPSQSVAGGRAFGQGVPASGGIGFGGGLIGLAGSAAQSGLAVGGLAADAAGGGGGGSAGAAVASAAMQIGIQEIQRAIGAGGQYVGALAGGLLETFSLNDSALADPGKSWLGRIGVAVAGARPALPNSAGEMGGKENKNMAEGGKKPPGPMSPQQAKGGKGGQPGADGANGSNVGKGDGTTYNLSVTNNNNNTRFDPTHNDMQNLMSASAASRQPR